MKVFVLTEIDCTNSPTNVLLSTTLKEANEMMQRMYAGALEKYGVPESDANNSFVADSHAVIGHVGYYLDIFSGEFPPNVELLVLQEMTVQVEMKGIRSKLMDGTYSRDNVWEKVQEWANEFNEKYAGFDYYANDTSLYDEIDGFVDDKLFAIQHPYSRIKRDEGQVDTDFIDIVDPNYFGDDKPHSIRVTTQDGVARADGITLEYPKVWALTDEQISEIDEYTGGRITDSGCITPWDVCVKFAKIVHFGVISTWGDGHNPSLVASINRAWVEEKERFKLILLALYERDIDEITDADCFLYDQWKAWPEYNHGCETKDWGPYNKRALEIMKEKWDFYADNYLDHIADDIDLVGILNFLHR
jgi:hypothetical protein